VSVVRAAAARAQTSATPATVVTLRASASRASFGSTAPIFGGAATESLSTEYGPHVLEFRILGPLEVSDGGAPVRLGGPKQRATLAILLLGVNRVVSVDRLADDLYAGEPPVTAVTQVQRQVSELRKALGDASVIETRAPGYVLRLAPEQLNLARFERLAAEAGRSEPARAAELLREALGIWRGDPLADLAAEPFAHLAVHRLDEIRLAALEQRIDADLALGRHRELVGELETLVAEEPLRERFRAQLMLALYRAGRQAEALDAYRAARETLVEELGIEPAPALRELERAILAHDPTLEPGAAPEPARAVLAVGAAALTAAALLPDSELIAARLLAGEEEVERAAAELTLAAPAGARVAAFTSDDAAADVVRFAAAYDVELVLLDAPAGLDGERVPADLAAVLERSPAPVAVLTRPVGGGEGVFVPFGGGEHDWAALEVGARLAAATAAPLRLVGTKAAVGRRDASRLLADASLAVQRVVGVVAAPVLTDPGGLVEAVADAQLVVVGIAPRWRQVGLGSVRRALVAEARPPVLLVHRGLRPGPLAPRESRTSFTWSIAA
jgi:DNA-binding SARP family transcriptional activator